MSNRVLDAHTDFPGIYDIFFCKGKGGWQAFIPILNNVTVQVIFELQEPEEEK
jgi:hypothetical protein